MGELRDRVIVGRLFDQFGPVVDLGRADAAGVARATLRRAEAQGFVRRVAKAAFVLETAHLAADEWERFRLRSIGFGLCTGPTAHLTGWAAAMMHKFPVFGEVPSKPTALRPGNAHNASDVTPHGRVRTGHLPLQHRTIRSGVPTVGRAYTVIDVARHFGSLAGLFVADAAMALGVHREVLARLTTEMEHYPGMSTARWVVEHADGRCESPLETLGRFAFISGRRVVPESNVWTVTGGRAFRVDHYLPEVGVVIEGDGALKYNDRPDADEVIGSQIERERLLRSLGLGMVRYKWDLALYRPRELLRRVDQEARLVSGRAAHVPWWSDNPLAGTKLDRLWLA